MRCSPITTSLLLLPLGGCLTPPSAAVETPAGVVRASNEELAQEVAEYVVWAHGELDERMPGLRGDARFDVWVQDRLHAGLLWGNRLNHMGGFTMQWSESPVARIHVPAETYRRALPHELTHVLLGDDWSTLPTILEEGLCDAMNVALAGSSEQRLHLLLSATSGDRLRHTSPRARPYVGLGPLLETAKSLDLSAHGGDYAVYAYGMSYFLVQRILERRGMAGLHDLCTRARRESRQRVPATWILQAADLQLDTDLAPLIDHQVKHALLDHLVETGELERLLDEIDEAQSDASWNFAGVTTSYSLDDLEGVEVNCKLVELPGFEDWRAGLHRSRWINLEPDP